MTDTETTATLSPQQEAFCQFYTQIRETFGNATKSYAEAYDYDLEATPRDDEVWGYEDDPDDEYGDEDNKHRGKWKKLEKSSYDKMCDVCASCASKLLRNPKIDKRVKELLATMPNETIDARLNEIIAGGKHKDSIAAIKELNKLRQRITEKLDVTSGGKIINGFNFVRNEEARQEKDSPGV